MGQNSRIKIAWKSHQGRVRKTNEDSVLIDEHLRLFAVADGMGGHNAGDVASQIAVNSLSKVIKQGLEHEIDATTLLKEGILSAHHAILEASRTYPCCEEMGTTMVAAFFPRPGSVVIGHVGDSRAYLIEHETIEALTQDHTFLAEWLREGSITPNEARNHPARHGLFMALGIDDEIEPELRTVALSEDACLLLCSDGLTDALDESEIIHIISSADSMESACEHLVTMANDNVGQDNVTVVLVREVPVDTHTF